MSLIDSIITACRVLKGCDLTPEPVQHALKDLAADPDFARLKSAAPMSHEGPVTAEERKIWKLEAALRDFAGMATKTSDPDPAFQRAYAEIATFVRNKACASLVP